MRVAVYPDSESPPFAYKLGRVVDGQHNHNLVTGEITPIEDILDGLVKQAQEEFPDAHVVIEKLHDNGDGSSEWRSADEEVTPVESSEINDVGLSTQQEALSEQGEY